MPAASARSIKNRTPAGAVACAWVFLISVTSFLPSPIKAAFHTRGRLHLWDHFFIFMLSAACLFGATRKKSERITLLLLGVVVGCGLEVAQHMVYGTHLEVHDMLMDSLGLLAGSLVVLAVQKAMDATSGTMAH